MSLTYTWDSFSKEKIHQNKNQRHASESSTFDVIWENSIQKICFLPTHPDYYNINDNWFTPMSPIYDSRKTRLIHIRLTSVWQFNLLRDRILSKLLNLNPYHELWYFSRCITFEWVLSHLSKVIQLYTI